MSTVRVVPAEEQVAVTTVSHVNTKSPSINPHMQNLLWLALVAWALRLLVILVLAQTWNTHALFPDEWTYNRVGWNLQQSWALGGPWHDRPVTGDYGYYYWVASIFSVVGRQEIVVKMLNALCSASLVFCLFGLGRQLAGHRVGWYAALLWSVWPAALFWSGLNLKIHLVIAATVLWIWSLGRWHESGRHRWWLSVAVAALALMHLQRISAHLLIGLTSVWCVWRFWRQRPTPRRGVVAGAISVVGSVCFAWWVSQHYQFIDVRAWDWVTRWRGTTTLGASTFWENVDLSSPGRILAFLPIGWSYLLAAPFPWAVPQSMMRWTMPEVLLWYGVLGFAIFGASQLHKVAWSRRFLVLLWCGYVGILGSVYVLLEGNYAALYRHRYQLMPWVFILASWGYQRWRDLRVSTAHNVGGVL